MKKNDSISKLNKIAAVVWACSVLMLIGTLFILLPKSKLNNSIMDLLPQAQIKEVPSTVLNEFNKRLDQQLIWLISAPTLAQTESAAQDWVLQLKAMPELQNINGKITEQQQNNWGKYIDQNRIVLLDSQTKEQLKNGAHLPWVLGQLYSPFAGVSAAEINRDPLLLTRSLALAQQKNGGALTLCNGWLCGADENDHKWIMIRAELKASSYDIKSSSQTIETLNKNYFKLRAENPKIELLQRGTIFYSQYASEQAQKDISTIGVLSGIGILLTILLIFRSSRPLWLTLLSLGVGLLSGTTMVLLFYGEIHIITLVMSTSIIGVSIDYALLYLTERMINGATDSPKLSLNKLFRPLLGALVSTAIAYLVMVFAPFSALQQFSVFAVSGLIAAFLCVVCWFPFCVNKLPVRAFSNLTGSLVTKWLNLWQKHPYFRYALPLIVLILSILGISQLKIDDDIAKLQTLPAHLQNQEQKIAQITGQKSDQKWFIVAADSSEKALKNLEILSQYLSTEKDNGSLDNFRAMPLPSLETQKDNIQLIAQEMPIAENRLKEEGLSVQSQPKVSAYLLPPKEWLASPISEGWRLLYSEASTGHTAILVPLEGIKNEAKLKSLTQKISGVYWIDRKTEISELFANYRVYMSWLLVASLFAIGALFLIRFKLDQGIRCLLPLLLSLSMALASLGLLGVSLNLFSLMGLILVLGIGIDYTLFFGNPKGTSTVSMLTIVAAAFISELTFGLLAFSQTQAVSGFGIVLSIGIFVALVLSPLAIPKNNIEQ